MDEEAASQRRKETWIKRDDGIREMFFLILRLVIQLLLYQHCVLRMFFRSIQALVILLYPINSSIMFELVFT